MRSIETDVAIIGAGTAGLTARHEAKKRGAKQVLLIEGGAHGTTCARVGCMPSKLLIAAADVAEEMRAAEAVGIHLPQAPRIDGRAVMKRVQAERDRFVGFVLDSVSRLPDEQKLRGYARFVGPTSLVVDDHTRVEARAVVIAAGTRPRIPPLLQGVGHRVITNEQIFELTTLPSSVAVVGTGVIGLELGQALHRLGVRVAIFGRSGRLGPVRDPEIQVVIRKVLGAELDLRLGVELIQARNVDAGVEVTWKEVSGTTESETFEQILVATGRVPNLDRLDLQAAGLELDARGIPVFHDRTMQCGDAPVFLAGDVTNERSVLHEAADEGRLAGGNAATYPEVRAACRRTALNIAFTDPQIAVVGKPRDSTMCKNGMGEVRYEDQGRARVMRKNHGIVRVYAGEPRAQLLGAEMFGPRVEHTAHLLAWSIQAGMTVEDALHMPFYHPVVEEGIRTALRRLAANLQLDTKPLPLDCGPGV